MAIERGEEGCGMDLAMPALLAAVSLIGGVVGYVAVRWLT